MTPEPREIPAAPVNPANAGLYEDCPMARRTTSDVPYRSVHCRRVARGLRVLLMFGLALLPISARAHAPFVEPWMHAANLSASVLLGSLAVGLLHRRRGLWIAVPVGLLTSAVAAMVGWFLSLVMSL